MAIFAELLVKIGGDATGFSSAMDTVASKTDATVKQTEQKLAGLTATFSSIGAKLAGGLGFAALGAGILNTALKFEEAGFTLRRATGAVGADLAALEKSFQNIYTTSARSAEEISGALASIRVETKLSGVELEALTKANLAFAKVTGTDVKTAIESTQTVFKNWSIAARDQAAALDILYRVIQETKISSASLTAQMAAAGPIVRVLGLTFQETAALVGNMEERGVNAEKVLAALSAGFKKLAKDSADPRQALLDLIERMKGAKDSTEAAAMAAPIFGRNAVVMADAVKRGAMDITDFTAQLEKNSDTVRNAAKETESFKATLTKFQHQVESLASQHKDLIIGVGSLGMAWTAFGGVITGVAAKLSALALANPLAALAVAATGAILVTIKALDDLEKKYDSFEKRQKGGKEYLPGQKPEDQFSMFQGQDVTAGLGIKFVQDATTAVETHEDAIKRLKEEQKRLNDVLADAKLQYDAVARAYEKGTATAQQLSDAQIKLAVAQRAASPAQLTRDFNEYTLAELAAIRAQDQQASSLDKFLTAIQAVRDASQPWGHQLEYQRSALDGLTVSLHAAYLEMQKVAGQQLDVDWSKAGRGTTIQTAMDPNSSVALRRAADAAKQRAEELRDMVNSGAAAWSDYERAVKDAEEAEAKATGTTIKQTRALHEQRSALQELGRELNGAFRNFNRDLSSIVVGLFTGDRQNDAIKKEEAALQESLATRAAEWATYQQSIADQIVAMRQKYADELAGEEADLAASLAEREQEYVDAVAEYESDLATARADNAKGLADDLAELAASLDERRGEYEDYVADVRAKFQETRADHSASLAATLRDLEDALDDKRRSYALYVDDVNQSLGRIHEDYAESIDDQTKATKRGIAEKQKAYDRDQQDTLARIAQLKGAGKKETDQEITDLRLSLKRKAEDLAEYIAEENADLEEFVSDAQRRLKREEDDLAESLKERTDEYRRYIAENSAKRAEETAKNAADLAKEEAALAKSLADRTAAWVKYQQENEGKVSATIARYAEALAKEESALQASLDKKRAQLETYRTDTERKLGEMRATYAEKMDDEEADLRASLADRLKEYDQFQVDTAAKLEQLRQEFQSVWDKISGAFGTMFTNMGGAITQFGIEFLEGRLFKWFGSLIDDILPNVGKAISSALGRLGSAAGSTLDLGGYFGGMGATAGKVAAPAASGAASAASAASSAAAWAGVAATAVGAAITAIGQARMEGTLNAIEKEARYAQIHLYYLLDQANKYWPAALDTNTYLWAVLDQRIVDSLSNQDAASSALGGIWKLLHEEIEPEIKAIRWIMGEWYGATGGFTADLIAATRAVGEDVADALDALPAGSPAAAPEIPAAPDREIDLGALMAAAAAGGNVARPGGAGVAELQALLAAQQSALANALRGFDPRNPLGGALLAARDKLAAEIEALEKGNQVVSDEQRAQLKALSENQIVTTQEAYLRNAGAAYRSWLNDAIRRTEQALAQWASYAAAQKAVADLAEVMKAITGPASVFNPANLRNPLDQITFPGNSPAGGESYSYQPRDTPARSWPERLTATINVMLDGRQVGNAVIENLALQGVSM